MTKKEMARKLADETDISVEKATTIIDVLFSVAPGDGIIADELAVGREVEISGFGTFESRHRAVRVGRNPATGEPTNIGSPADLTFRPLRGLGDRVSITDPIALIEPPPGPPTHEPEPEPDPDPNE
jgi:DNA-binding protein HU-beta